MKLLLETKINIWHRTVNCNIGFKIIFQNLNGANIIPFSVYTDCITTLQCTVLIYYIDMFQSIITDVFNLCSTVQYCVFAFIKYRIFVIYIALYSEMMTSDQYCTELQCVIVRYIGVHEVSNTADCYQLYRSSRIHYVNVYLNFLCN